MQCNARFIIISTVTPPTINTAGSPSKTHTHILFFFPLFPPLFSLFLSFVYLFSCSVCDCPQAHGVHTAVGGSRPRNSTFSSNNSTSELGHV